MTEFPPQLPHGELTEVLPDVFFVTGQMRMEAGERTFFISRNMTVIRDGADLTLINTMRLDEAGLAYLESLGTVSAIVKLGAFHGRDDAFYIDRYGAPMWAPADMPHDRGVVTDRVFAPGEPGPCANVSAFIFETSSTSEAILHLDRHGGVLVSCDSLQNWAEADAFFDTPSAEFMAANGFIAPANVGPGWLRGSKPDRSDFVRLQELRYRHLLSSHGTPLLENAHEAIGETLKKLFEI